MFAYLGLQNFIAQLQAPLAADDVSPSIRFDKVAKLCATLSNGAHTYLTLECPGGFEIVRARCEFGVIVFDRGQDGTSAQPFPIGSCLRFAWVGAAIADMVEQTMACPRPCTPATIVSGATLPDGVAGTIYSHRIVIGGTPPFALGDMVIPQWMIVTLDAGEIRLNGTPDAPGAFPVQIPLQSCGELRAFVVGCVNVAPADVPVPT
jgi:hypothetical protein